MIFDGENMFCDEKTLSSSTLYSDVVNLGPGESYQPMFLQTIVNGGTGSSAALTVTVQTADNEEMTSAEDLAEFEMSGAKARHSLPMPRGNLGYVRLKMVSTYTGGTVSAGLTVDDEIEHRK